MRLLAVADIIEPRLYNSAAAQWLGQIDMIISCGDLPPYYLDYLVSNLNVPLLHVLGNHCFGPHDLGQTCSPQTFAGAYNLNGHVADYNGLLLAGLEGSPLYNGGPHQYTEQQVRVALLKLVPFLLRNKVRTGRYLDVMVTHAPPRGIQDNNDLAHQGFVPLLSFIRTFRPALLLHGHVHRYDPMLPMQSDYSATRVINAYGHAIIDIERTADGWTLPLSQGSKR
ncbi:MAG: metallophosphoesterase [Chloroflexota bacterium]|nr:metallophosphoesterase [Chloroflexota bacterium]